MEDHEKFMNRCLELSGHGLGLVYPNPMVGAVVVCNNKIIGEGWHQKAGSPHAEVNAIHAVRDKGLLQRSTIYVNLEPCSHHGRTPPCADLILKSGIPRVVVGSLDPNPIVSGRGVKRLKDNGVEVISGVLRQECEEINKRFYTFHKKKRPYVILKWAQSKDGFIFPDAENIKKGSPVWITNEYSRQIVHQWRTEEASILVGRKTVEQDNPQLNSRDFKGSQIYRIIIDPELRLKGDLNIFDSSCPTLVFNSRRDDLENNIEFCKLDSEKDVTEQILKVLYIKGIQSLIVEGGSVTLNSFIESGFWDEARVFVGNSVFLNGIKAPDFKGKLQARSEIGKDILYMYKKMIDG
ncbi:bifunctional diaminohydroxyphosphoribosylaminopyrimidine deaminase/5-amino-6-(5-phosphoribosylamino)uracil reductase RibD [Lutimonas saemankumensis]|uniref:bifunctional diaminohydroxyphosphoribosylaminopyrimidine deaminase/5-amino-6-(5-phosphoribosylamino)uracil reductase RibD n=1 Tax=Lutimonas saemankumensis TaxID=483016 RepID=UPI001CD47A44|nr:bifunctional diaminohydroxyphosphoribosylaminopyrimidine deaminase/5-amino-6-(5-phosphoribosylamino)uracil reductase RibD [Lutimonas saemankumensis]MCA0932328.1 bifunctional diaminohydroxyphosphoribosylaminopyrimidine deaminase/5-amino-6-(5-phosphoribosylamino)uracil reductase RibD [Lutimonas saemankumensis]